MHSSRMSVNENQGGSFWDNSDGVQDGCVIWLNISAEKEKREETYPIFLNMMCSSTTTSKLLCINNCTWRCPHRPIKTHELVWIYSPLRSRWIWLPIVSNRKQGLSFLLLAEKRILSLNLHSRTSWRADRRTDELERQCAHLGREKRVLLMLEKQAKRTWYASSRRKSVHATQKSTVVGQEA